MTRTKVAVPKPAALAEANASSLPRGVKRREDANGAPSYALAGLPIRTPIRRTGDLTCMGSMPFCSSIRSNQCGSVTKTVTLTNT